MQYFTKHCMSNIVNYPDQTRDELLYELFKRRYDEESARTAKLDDKANNLIGFISIIVGLLMTEGTFKISSLLKNAHLEYLLALYLVSIGILLASIVKSLYAFRIRTWNTAPAMDDLTGTYDDKSYQIVLVNVNDDLAKSVNHNAKNNDEKAKSLEISWILLLVGLFCIFAFIIILAIASGINISNT